MRFASQSGSLVELDIVGYEQPPPETPTSEDDGGDWLIIHGRIADAGRSWEFEASCLDTDDASQLHAWLLGVADKSFAPSNAPGWGPHAISFAEPLLEFRLIAHKDGRPVIRLLLLAAPSWGSESNQMIEGKYPVDLVVDEAELRLEIDSWQKQLSDFPRR